MTLSELAVGTAGQVTGVSGADEITMRLLEMGLTPGVNIVLIGAAPLGDPLEIEVRGYRLSLRRAEAERVKIAALV